MNLPWDVLQANTTIPDTKYKPVDLIDCNGEQLLRVGTGDEALRVAHQIRIAVNAYPQLVEALRYCVTESPGGLPAQQLINRTIDISRIARNLLRSLGELN